MITGRDILYISSIEWDFLWQAHQEIARHLAAAGNRVLYIENTGVRAPGLRDTKRVAARLGRWTRSLKSGGVREVAANIFVYSPLVLPPFGSTWQRLMNRHVFLRQLRGITRTMQVSDVLLWTYLPTDTAVDIIRAHRTDRSLVIYYSAADFSYLTPNSKQLQQSEQELARMSDLVFATCFVVGPPEFNRTDVWLSQSTPGRHQLALNNVILYAVQAALRRAGLYQFHAGCVLSGNDRRAILLVGDSGCGKSTLTATLVHGGWNFVSDDNLLLRESPAGIAIWALRRYFTFDEATMKACNLTTFKESIGGRLPGKTEKFRFYAREAFPGKFVETCLPGAILFPTISREPKSRIEPLSQRDALTRLIRQCPWATCDAAAAPLHLQVLSKLARQTRSYTLFAGRDIFETPASIPGLIAQQIEIL